MKPFGTSRWLAALLLALFILCPACSSKVTASTIELTKTQGSVGVADGDWNTVSLQENMKLYSGYHVSTEEESYAWINLDSTKLAKMDVNSQLDIQKSGNQLEVLVNSGGLFFQVTQPLAGDETMTIRTSTMAVDIRGACGWVEAVSQEVMRVYVLEGTVGCSLPDLLSGQTLTQSVTAGEMAELTASSVESSITVAQFTAAGIPSFVAAELDDQEQAPQQFDLDEDSSFYQ